MEAADPFDLDRFVKAQAPVFAVVLEELANGRKRTHWMWFVFPQMRGLGSSSISMFYGIGSLAEARAYLAHPLLGPRLVACTETVLAIERKTLHEIFGSPDDMKFASSMTLFARASDDDGSVFRRALGLYCQDRPDDRTLALLRNVADNMSA
jgi:uncharacterized protein (DUF1810 family)